MITGATGFVGAALCRYFHQIGYQVIAIGRQEAPPAALLLNANYICWDITDKSEPFDADLCIHAAGLTSDTASYQSLHSANVTGTSNVLHAAQKCSYLIFISSSSVYNFSGGPAREQDARLELSLSAYGKTKLLAEELVCMDIPAHQKRLILRPRAIYGIGDRVLLPRVLKLIKGKTIYCPVSQEILTSATNIYNLAYAIDCYLKQANKPQLQIFNIADDSIYQLKDIILGISNAIDGPGLKVVNIPIIIIKTW